MRRGELYRVRRPAGDTKLSRVFVVVSRQALLDSAYSTVICAPVFSQYHGLPTEIAIGTTEGLKHESSIQRDELASLEKARLTNFNGELAPNKLRELDIALFVALGLRA